jgi:starch synthase
VAFQSGIPADTLIDAAADRLAAGEANGFLFHKYGTSSLHTALTRAVTLYRQKDAWSRLVQTAASGTWPWRKTAQAYAEIYEHAAKRLKRRATA